MRTLAWYEKCPNLHTDTDTAKHAPQKRILMLGTVSSFYSNRLGTNSYRLIPLGLIIYKY